MTAQVHPPMRMQHAKRAKSGGSPGLKKNGTWGRARGNPLFPPSTLNPCPNMRFLTEYEDNASPLANLQRKYTAANAQAQKRQTENMHV